MPPTEIFETVEKTSEYHPTEIEEIPEIIEEDNEHFEVQESRTPPEVNKIIQE